MVYLPALDNLELDDVVAPAAVLALAGGEPLRPVWRNEAGGLTFEVGSGRARRFVKWAPAGSGLDLAGERERLAWAGGFAVVPRVLGAGSDAEGAWLVTVALTGTSAVLEPWRSRPQVAVAALGAGLRRLHEQLPVEGCPFDWSVGYRLRTRLQRPRSEESRRRVEDFPAPPPVDRLVVCHGDACAPNTLLGEDGVAGAHVDLDALGVADRWADLAVGSWSTEWNYGPGWEEAYFSGYGIAPDAERIAYYRALWALEE
ncbi:phosphotransferase [Kineococcus sp. NUM-3379]